MKSMVKLLIIKIKNHQYFHHDQSYQYLLDSQIVSHDPIKIRQAHSRVVARRDAQDTKQIQNTIGVNIQTRDYVFSIHSTSIIIHRPITK